ncbi:MAG: LptF/LptG family permease [Planctomycetes bacterium]|jgi:lipopolysaccharide export system permease protein|nr:LptF/LptG family permease [Planctomycetota bacterium]
MPLTLYRYIMGELLKLLVLSTAVLVTVMAVGFVILKTVSDGMPSALGLVKLIAYVVPVMLPYALPVTAAFSATLVYFRMSADNEITACAMSGVSYRSLLTPVLVLGLAVTLGLFFLSNYVIPGFWARVEQAAQTDVARMVVQQLQGHDVVEMGELVLYADDAALDEDLPRPADVGPDEPWPYQRVILYHGAVGTIDGQTGRLGVDATGERAVADFYRHTDGHTYVTVKFVNATVRHPQTGLFVSTAEQNIPAQRLPSFFQVKPRFLSLDRLHEISQRPEEHQHVAQKMHKLRDALMIDQLLADMLSTLRGERGGGSIRFDGPQNQHHTLTAPIARRDPDHPNRLLLAGEGDQRITVRVGRGLDVRQTLRAKGGRLDAEIRQTGAEPQFEIKLDQQVTVRDAQLPTPNERSTVYLPLLRVDRSATARWRDPEPSDLRAAAVASERNSVRRAYRRLKAEIVELRRGIAIAVNERAALSVCAMMVMALGAVMSMNLRRQTPLVIFFWCFLPAVLGMFLIAGGGKNVADANPFGFGAWFTALMIWSGNLFLLAVTWLVYQRLARH